MKWPVAGDPAASECGLLPESPRQALRAETCGSNPSTSEEGESARD